MSVGRPIEERPEPRPAPDGAGDPDREEDSLGLWCGELAHRIRNQSMILRNAIFALERASGVDPEGPAADALRLGRSALARSSDLLEAFAALLDREEGDDVVDAADLLRSAATVLALRARRFDSEVTVDGAAAKPVAVARLAASRAIWALVRGAEEIFGAGRTAVLAARPGRRGARLEIEWSGVPEGELRRHGERFAQRIESLSCEGGATASGAWIELPAAAGGAVVDMDGRSERRA